LVPRGEDTMISFMAMGTETEYIQTKFIKYLSTWTKILTTVFISLTALYIMLGILVFDAIKTKVLAQTQIASNITELNKKKVELEKEADKFNFYVNAMSQAVLHERD
jgi:hypothetical protein